MTVRASIFQAFVDVVTLALAGIATVEKSRDASTQPTPATLPIVCLYDGGTTFVTRRVGVKVYSLALKAEMHVARKTSAELDDAMDALYAAMVTAVETSSKFGGLAIRVDDETSEPTIDQTAGASSLGFFDLTFNTQYATATTDPSVRG